MISMRRVRKQDVQFAALSGGGSGNLSRGLLRSRKDKEMTDEDYADAAKGALVSIFALTLRLAKRGYPDAQWKVGDMYFHGRGVEQNDASAVLWYKASADFGDPDGLYRMGLMYHWGIGVRMDESEAVRLWVIGANRVHAACGYRAGLAYYFGKGVKRDIRLAANFWLGSAKAGHPLSMYSIGGLCDRGEGVVRDQMEAVKWYLSGAAQGSKECMLRLAAMFIRGEGVRRNEAKALYWIQRAKEGIARSEAAEWLDNAEAQEHSLGYLWYEELLASVALAPAVPVDDLPDFGSDDLYAGVNGLWSAST
jgi:TPR repeat protein